MKNVGAAEIAAQAIAEGMLTLRMDGWLKVIKGIASLTRSSDCHLMQANRLPGSSGRP